MSGSIRRTVKTSSEQTVLIGARLRASRLGRGLTLGQVASAAGLTEGFVSKLERDQVSPSVASLVAVCEAVGMRVGDLFEPPVTSIVRAGKGAPINFGGEKVREYLLSPGNQNHIEVLQSIIEPGGSAGEELYSLDCEIEFVFVVQGTLEMRLGAESFVLETGDSMTFKGKEPHSWKNPSATEGCQVLWMMAPAP
jgi:transcriptional regulator with XRE-family HTH domain